jgi:hypothetical protein
MWFGIDVLNYFIYLKSSLAIKMIIYDFFWTYYYAQNKNTQQ